jgi:hypothetical protein
VVVEARVSPGGEKPREGLSARLELEVTYNEEIKIECVIKRRRI